MRNICLVLFIACISCSNPPSQYRESLDLQGQWQFALDPANVGIEERWYLSDLEETVDLPGTTDTNQKGILNQDTTTMHLHRLYTYEGAAWYRKSIRIPKSFKDKHIQLVLERSRSSMIWIDTSLVGSSHLLQSPQQFDVSDYLSPGEHHITIQVNNELKRTPYGNVHIYSDDTQTNWNGILGKIYLEAASRTYISNLQVYPDIEERKVDVELEIINQLPYDQLNIELQVELTDHGKTTRLKSMKYKTAVQPEISLSYLFDDSCRLWDEYEQPVYHLSAVISNGKNRDARRVAFGMREFAVRGTQFTINGRTTFLRGKHEAAVFPLTGFPPMNVDEWRRVYKIAKSYGINHYRFHSYCPPEAAFTAADLEGIYLQAELPFWGGLDSDTIAGMLKEEGLAMLKAYANHPSFVMFSPGNELWSGHDRIEQNMLAFKNFDSRPLLTMGSNNNIGFMEPRAYCDFFVGARIPLNGDTTLGHTRLTHAFADAWEGGILNTRTPSTEVTFDYAVSHMKIPLISHEIGQYQIFPDYRQIDKYTGVLRAWNLEVFRDRLIKAGMAGMDSAFQQASGAWSALCYKAEMEAAVRTRGLAGFQLLDLQDFPGQGTALVGILNALMESKEVITPQAWKQSCNDVVLLLEFPKYCWTNRETFHAKLVVANYSREPIQGPLNWEIRRQDGTVLDRGSFSDILMENEGLSEPGDIDVDLGSISQAEELTLQVSTSDSEYSNTYPIWVYPYRVPVRLQFQVPEDLLIAEKLNDRVLTSLHNGARVLLFPQSEDVKENSLPGLFPPDFWNWGMFKGISERGNKPVSPGTLGLLMDPDHPLLSSFPSDFHTNWQWFSIVKASNSLILDRIPGDYRPIVQVIDNLERNHKLGLIFEFKVDQGKLLVCMSQLTRLMDRPEALQLYQSILDYMDSDHFNPEFQLSAEDLSNLLN